VIASDLDCVQRRRLRIDKNEWVTENFRSEDALKIHQDIENKAEYALQRTGQTKKLQGHLRGLAEKMVCASKTDTRLTLHVLCTICNIMCNIQ
jgi:hypothetical protein